MIWIIQNIPLIGILINGIGLMITLVKFTGEQKKSNLLKEKEDLKLEYKLKIFNILLDDCLSYQDIHFNMKNITPLNSINELELKKCLYEMLVEDTIGIDENQKYFVNYSE